jgi:hypothetical protein
VLKLIDKLCWIAAAFVLVAAIFGASTGYAKGLTPVCVQQEDAYDVVVGQLNHKAVWQE